MLTKVVKTKNNTYNVTLDIICGDVEYEIESENKAYRKRGRTSGRVDYIKLVKQLVSEIEDRSIFQEDLFNKWDGIID